MARRLATRCLYASLRTWSGEPDITASISGVGLIGMTLSVSSLPPDLRSTQGAPVFERGTHVEMTQTDKQLTVVIAPDAGGRVVHYPLDGSDGFTSSADGTALKTKTSWQGVALVTDTQSTEKGRSFKSHQVRTLDANGRP